MRKEAENGRNMNRHSRSRAVTKFVEYVGSFAVEALPLQEKIRMIHEQLQALKVCTRRRAVILKFSLQGVKMYSADGEALLMAHALSRILYTTCQPRDCQFAFVARNPQSPGHELFCHLYVGGQPSEVQLLNLLLSRSFQLHYLAVHPGEQEPARPPGNDARVGLEEVSQNVNALVSFRRFSGPSNRKEVTGSGNRRSSVQDNPYCSPTLVRKKAIRSKVIRSGAYRCANYDAQLRHSAQDMSQSGSCGSTAHLLENEGLLQEMVWFFTGICRDSGISLLRKDALGAFLLWTEPDSAGRWTLAVRTHYGVIPYQVLKSELGAYRFEHMSEEFPSLAALVEHHSGPEGGLFDCLDLGRIHHCYEEQDWRQSWTVCHRIQTSQIMQEPGPHTELAA
ncbi:SH2 domain-containing protein 5 isoform X2 [Rhinatrema bivittatum]|nr:SH2 domain-containing protein 5 isoform X2 [Rhinatrema bivittatum]XP_029434306.1 SH2 domain-containing protein 5 isoform X2 [Rhinatrema bivittatum]